MLTEQELHDVEKLILDSINERKPSTYAIIKDLIDFGVCAYDGNGNYLPIYQIVIEDDCPYCNTGIVNIKT